RLGAARLRQRARARLGYPDRLAPVRRSACDAGRKAHYPAGSGADAVIRWFFRILAAAVAVYGIGFAVFAMTLPKPAGDEPTDAIVVLTGGTGRLERGFDLIQRRVAGQMLISGVERTVRPQELAAHYNVTPALFD